MRRLVPSLAMAVPVGCARPDAAPPAADTTAAMPAPPATTLADFAGTWQIRGMNAAGDSLLSYQVVATADESAWSTVFPGRDPVAMTRVELMGDSVVTEAGPFESALRAGVQVRTHSTWRLEDGRLVGSITARYATTGPDSVASFRAEGVRVP